MGQTAERAGVGRFVHQAFSQQLLRIHRLPAVAQTGPETLTRKHPMSIPLDPGRGGRSVGDGALAMGDILVSTTPALSSAAIRIGAGADVSHARLYIGAGQVVEAVGEGVMLAQLEDVVAHDSLCVAYRSQSLTEGQALLARDFAGMQIGKQYSYIGIG